MNILKQLAKFTFCVSLFYSVDAYSAVEQQMFVLSRTDERMNKHMAKRMTERASKMRPMAKAKNLKRSYTFYLSDSAIAVYQNNQMQTLFDLKSGDKYDYDFAQSSYTKSKIANTRAEIEVLSANIKKDESKHLGKVKIHDVECDKFSKVTVVRGKALKREVCLAALPEGYSKILESQLLYLKRMPNIDLNRVDPRQAWNYAEAFNVQNVEQSTSDILTSGYPVQAHFDLGNEERLQHITQFVRTKYDPTKFVIPKSVARNLQQSP